MDNINDIYFDGYYKDIWRSIIPTELTVKEIDFFLQYFQLGHGNRMLDIMCGYGRHALSMGRKGIEVVAVDNLSDYIDEVSKIAQKENLPVKAIHANVAEFVPQGIFDLAICMGNSLNFFPASNMANILSITSAHLKPTACLVINSWSLAEIAIKQFVSKSWETINGLIVLSDSRYLFHPSRIETDTHIIGPDNKIETKKAIDYIFSISEMEEMLAKSGFIIKEVYSIPGRKKFVLGDPRAYIIAQKSPNI